MTSSCQRGSGAIGADERVLTGRVATSFPFGNGKSESPNFADRVISAVSDVERADGEPSQKIALCALCEKIRRGAKVSRQAFGDQRIFGELDVEFSHDQGHHV